MKKLNYTKKIYDAVHGFIHFNDIERALIDTFAFQRLHYIRQLGISFLVYPGATHTRFEHSLGTMELATRIFDQLLKKQMQLEDISYWKQIVRLAALCHDLGHLPFSHDAESALLGKEGHEHWTMHVIQSEKMQPIWETLGALFTGHDVARDVLHIAIGQDKLCQMGVPVSLSPWENILSQIITADFFGADRIDYLLRDAKCTGVSYGTFDYHQLIETLCILPASSSICLGIQGNGIQSCEALLLARHFMHQRVYQYSSVQACKFHLRRFMKEYYAQGAYMTSLEKYLSLSDNEILSALHKAAFDSSLCGHRDARAVLHREWRFRSIACDPLVSQERLQELQKALGIPEESIAWSLVKTKPASQDLNFPVRLSSGCIMAADKCSQIHIPSWKKSWVFLAPECEEKVFAEVERVLHD